MVIDVWRWFFHNVTISQISEVISVMEYLPFSTQARSWVCFRERHFSPIPPFGSDG
jgi:hypothetical protein